MPTLTDIRQQFPQYNDLPDEQLLAGLHRKFYADLPFDDFLSKVGASEEPGFVDNIVGSGKRGLLSAEQAMVTDAAATGMVSPETAGGYIADTQQQIDEIPVPESVRRFFGTETWSDAAVEFVQSPLEITSTLVAQSLGTSVPSFAGAAVGAGAGSLIGPGGTVAGGAIGLGAGSAATETGAKILESFAEQGVDLADPAQVAAAFANDELMESVRGDAVKRGVTIGVFDAVSGAIAGRLVAGARGVGSAVARGTGEVGIQSGLGMAGEAAGSAVIGDPISPPDVLAEGLGEIGTGGVEVAAGTAVRGLGAAGRARRGDEPVIRRPERVEDPYYTDEIVSPAEPEADVGPEVTPDAVPETATPAQEVPSGIAEAASPVLPGPEAVVEGAPAPQSAPSEMPDPIQRTAQAVAQLPQGQPISRALIQQASGLKGNMQVRAILAAMENAGYAEKRGDRYVSTGRASAASGGTGGTGPATEAVVPEPIETTPEKPLPEVVPEMARPEPGTRVRVLGQDGSEFGTATVAGYTDATRPRVRFVEGGVGPVKQPFADLVRMEPVEEMPQPGGLDPAAEQAAAAPTGSLSPDQAPPLAAPEVAEPQRRPARPRSAPVPLFQFIRDQGGIDPSDPLIGDVRATLDKQAFQLLRKPTAARTGVGGRRLDDLRGAAVQAGYLPEGATIADFLDAIQEDAFRQQEGQTRIYRDDDMAEVVEREQAAKENREAERYLARFPSLDVAESYVESVRDLENAVEEADRRLDEIEADIAEQTREVLNGEWSPEERPDDANIPFEWIAEREGREVEGAGGETASAGETGSEPGGGPEADAPRRDAGDGGEQAGGLGEPEGVATEQTDQGEQILTPGVRPVTDKDRAETKAAKPLRSDKAQKPADDGLFDVAGRGQGDLLSPSAQEPEATTEPEPTPGAPVRIEDFGEKLEGARKDTWRRLADTLSDDDIDVAAEPLSVSFPRPNYEKLAADGVDPKSLAFVALMRDSIPTKPRKGHKLARWVAQVDVLRGFASQLMSGEITAADVQERIRAPGMDYVTLRPLADTLDVIEGMPPTQIEEAAKFRVTSARYSMFAGQRYDPAKLFYSLEGPRRRRSNISAETLDDIIAPARAFITEAVGRAKDAASGRGRTPLQLYKDRDDGSIFIGFKGHAGVIRLKSGFQSVQEARGYMQENADDLQADIDQMRAGPNERRAENRTRKGPERRDEDVTPEKFQEAFGFRGVQFGNYVEGGRRQKDLNEAFDALMDMAETLGIPSRALSLDGKLGLAFGARGHGGSRAAAAHYEPGQIAINLTKNAGPGSLAHEWLHAVDDYFARQDDGAGSAASGFMTDRARQSASAREVRPEVFSAFQALREAITGASVVGRSLEVDKARSKPYWSTTIELAARSFEKYIIDRMAAQNVENDYLANIDEASGVYPSTAEMEREGIRDAFDRLFNTIEARETEDGRVGLFDIAETSARADAFTDAVYGRPTVDGEKARAAVEKLLARIAPDARVRTPDRLTDPETGRDRAYGLYIDGVIHVALNGPNADRTARHEAIHFLRQRGIISDINWRALTKAADDQDWIGRFRIRERYKRQGLTEGQMVEEAIAEGYAEWAAGGREEKGRVVAAFRHLRRFFDQVRAAIRRAVGREPDFRDLFSEIETGRMGQMEADTDSLAAEAAAAQYELANAYAETNPGHDIVDDATKAREESVGFHRRVIARMDRFLNPIEGLPEIRSYLAERYRTFGKIAQVQDVAGHLTEPFEKASKADSEAVYEYMTTKDASPDAIANRDVREAAVKAKRAVDKIGRQLVAKGLLRQEAYDRHKDAYLPRVYLRHLLEKQGVAGSATVTAGGKKVSDLGYLKQRKDIDENTRRFILGEILDPKYLASRALVKPARDIALLDFLDHVAKNERWIIPQSVVSWNGQRVTAAWLKSEAATLRRMTDHQSAEDAAVTSEIAKSMEAAAEDALREFGIRNSDIRDYRQVPDAPRYGRMRGLWVRKEIHEDLVGSTQWVTGDGGNFAQRLLSQGGTLTKATQLWKLGKVALNPPTQIRNAFSNAIMLHLSGVNGMMVIPRLIEAVQDMRAKGEYFQVARRYGITEATFAHNELFRLEGDLKEAMERSGSPMAKVAHLLGKIGNAAGDIYQGVESAFKIAKIIDEMKKGRTAETAALEAQKWLFDYSLVSGSTQYLRNAPLGVPFITYYTKVMPRLVEVAATKPWKLAPYVALPAALAAWVAAEYDVDQEDLDKLREALPTWLRNRGGGVVPLPYRDGNGNWQFVDLSYFFPWAMFEGLARAGASGDVTEFLSQAGILGGPVPQIISAFQTGIDPFSEKPIVDEFDRPAKKLASLLNFAWSLSMPPWMTEYGFANRLYEAMSGTVDPRTGKPRYTEGQAMLRAVGVNVYPIDPVASRASNIRRMKFEMSEVKSRMRRELRDKNLTPDQRRAIAADYREMLAARVEQMREYAAASQVNPKLLRPPQ